MTDKTLTRTSSQVAALCVVDLPHALYNSLLQVNVSTGTKKLVAAAAMGGVSLLLLARHFQRRRGKKKGGQSPQWEQMGAFEFSVLPVLQGKGKDPGCLPDRHQTLSPSLNSHKADGPLSCGGTDYRMSGSLQSLTSVKSINSSLSCTCAIDSSCWDRPGDEDLCGVVNIPVTTPENLYLMGMELFEEALRRWEQALTFRGRTGDEEEAQWTSVKLGAGDAIAEEVVEDLISPDFVHKLEGLLQRAYRLQEEFEGALGIPGPSSHSNSLAECWEVSAPGVMVCVGLSPWQLAEQHRDQSHIQSSLCRHSFYDEALRLAEEGQVSCRVPRTELLECLGDTDFLAKLHCVRQACQLILCETTTRKFLAETGKKVLSSIILKACKVGRPKRFEEVFEEMIVFLEHQEHWQNTEVELATRGVKHLNFYDIVLDFILMDSFEDLENPPMSIQNVVNNRWLNASFKETAVASSCWSVLKQKRQHVKVPDGFIAHFYSICEQISPVLAWGFLGPKTSLHDFCCFFKDQVLSFLKDIFHLEKVCYYSVETLAEDILRLLHHRSELMLAYLGADSPCDASPPYSLTPPATPLLPTA
uniref:Mitoguardin 1 n=1 Tax=Esox lucius TaxID=8010 RepID=A0A3P8ZQ17_ESOLU